MEKSYYTPVKHSFRSAASWSNRLIWALPVITVIVFLPTFFNGFQLGWDDTWQVLRNPLVQDASWENIVFHFTHFWERQYSPVNSLFYAAVADPFGFNATAFHTACLFVHLCSTFLVYGVIRQVLDKLLPQTEISKSHIYALFTALVFAIHPLQVESVAWISASKILLYAFFTLLALWCYIRYVQSSHLLWLIATAFAYALGFASKEQAIILPLNLLLVDYALGRFSLLTWKRILLSRGILEKIPFFLLAIAFWYFSWVNDTGSITQAGGYPFHQRLFFTMYSLTEYIFRFLAPVKLYFFHPFPVSPGESLPLYYWGYIPLVGIIGYYVWDHYRKGNRLVVVGFLFFLVNLLLVLHIIPLPRTVITADRYMYLSTAGLALILVWQMDQWLSRQPRSYKASLIMGSMIWFLFLGTHTYVRTMDWKDSETAKASVNDLIEKKQKAREIESSFNLIENE
ncbi:ArnT family glycosyltransferase [Negadavirga shengliensis]|uniref:ArnT family glycosyltransferase n=1 Tax=Negadavirga shengliensis TaxID=1389218 RepID=A0ABV9SXI2_9BACT